MARFGTGKKEIGEVNNANTRSTSDHPKIASHVKRVSDAEECEYNPPSETFRVRGRETADLLLTILLAAR
jgi:hypothetical protein